MRARLSIRRDSSFVDHGDWKQRMADLQGIMGATTSLVLLLEGHHEAIVRVALELALEPEVRRIFAWENWYQEPERRRGTNEMRPRLAGLWLKTPFPS